MITKIWATMAVAGACVMALGFGPAVARAGDSQYRTVLSETSLRAALGERTVPLLEVVPVNGGREAQLGRLTSFLATSPDRRIHGRGASTPISSDRTTLVAASDKSWYLRVSGDGSKFTYRGNIDDRDEIEAARRAPHLTAADLERLGRAYIGTSLRSLVPVGEGERLTFLGTKVLREGSATEAQQEFTSEVVASMAIFSREVMGTPVIGPGSKVVVWFSNTGEPVGFDVDWPEYRVTAQRQATLSVAGVRDRMARFADHPLEQIERDLSRFECGYVDLGVHKRGDTAIQTGCTAFHDGRTAEGLRHAFIEVLPIGMPVVTDPAWPVTGRVVDSVVPSRHVPTLHGGR